MKASPQIKRLNNGVEKILLLLRHRENLKQLTKILEKDFILLTEENLKNTIFDMIIVDGLALKEKRQWIHIKKEEQAPCFLPSLFISNRKDIKLVKTQLWRTIDEMVLSPIERVELRCRIEILLRARRLSVLLNHRNQDLQSMLYLITHDIRSPIRAIQGFTSKVLEKESSSISSMSVDLLKRVYESGDYINELIDATTKFLKIGYASPNMEKVNIESIIQDIIHNLHIRECNVNIKINIETKDIKTDKIFIRSIIYNLISNSLKYRKKDVPLNIHIHIYETFHTIKIEIKDNGIGIPEDKYKEIFNPFIRLHSMEEVPGYGLGLATVRRIVDVLGGRVSVTSRVNEGSIFCVELPKEFRHENSLNR